MACPACGPSVWLETKDERRKKIGEEAIREVRELLSNGNILAIKGLGGFHLACDATNAKAVSELRARKLRVDKPFV